MDNVNHNNNNNIIGHLPDVNDHRLNTNRILTKQTAKKTIKVFMKGILDAKTTVVDIHLCSSPKLPVCLVFLLS